MSPIDIKILSKILFLLVFLMPTKCFSADDVFNFEPYEHGVKRESYVIICKNMDSAIQMLKLDMVDNDMDRLKRRKEIIAKNLCVAGIAMHITERTIVQAKDVKKEMYRGREITYTKSHSILEGKFSDSSSGKKYYILTQTLVPPPVADDFQNR